VEPDFFFGVFGESSWEMMPLSCGSTLACELVSLVSLVCSPDEDEVRLNRGIQMIRKSATSAQPIKYAYG
jgi:hypothetical protein